MVASLGSPLWFVFGINGSSRLEYDLVFKICGTPPPSFLFLHMDVTLAAVAVFLQRPTEPGL